MLPARCWNSSKSFIAASSALRKESVHRSGAPGTGFMRATVCILHLSEAAHDEDRSAGVATTFDHIAFTCTDRPEMEARLKRNNVAFRVGTVPVLSITQLFLQDPAGNGVELSFKE